MEKRSDLSRSLIVMATNKYYTSACTNKLFPGVNSNGNGSFEIHRNPAHIQRLQVFKQYKGQSSGSTMSFESGGLPDYEDSDVEPCDGGAGLDSSTDRFHTLHQDAPCHETQDHHMKRLKTGASSFERSPITCDMSESSFTFGHGSTFPAPHTSSACEDIRLTVYEIPWDTKMSCALFHRFIRCDAVYILVLDVDEICKSNRIRENYLKMIDSLDAYCTHGRSETCPRAVVVGISQITSNTQANDVQNAFTKAVDMFQNEIIGHPFESHFEDNAFLLNDSSQIVGLKNILFNDLLPTVGQTMNKAPSSFLTMNRLIEHGQNEGLSYTYTQAFVKEISSELEEFRSNPTETAEYVEKFLAFKDATADIIYVSHDGNGIIWMKPEIAVQACITLSDKIKDPTVVGERLFKEVKNVINGKENIRNLVAVLDHIGFIVKIKDHPNQMSKPCNSTFVMPVNFENGRNLLPKEEYMKYHTSPVLRLSFESRIPEYVFCGLITDFIRDGWTPAEQGTRILVYKTEAAFSLQKPTRRLVMSKDDSNIYAVIIRYEDNQDPVQCKECDTIRRHITQSVYKSYRMALEMEKTNLFKYQVRCTETEGSWNGEEGWIDVKALEGETNGIYQCTQHSTKQHPHPVKSSALLNAWFHEKATSGVEKMETSIDLPNIRTFNDHANEQIQEALIPKIACCFGRYWDLFFVEQGLPQAVIDQIKADGRGGQVEQVKTALQHWVHSKREKGMATITHLQKELKLCKSVTINWHEFNDVVRM